MKKKIFTLLLAIMLLCTSFASCKKEEKGADETTVENQGEVTTVTTATDSAENVNEEDKYLPEAKKYGCKYTMMVDTNGDKETPFYFDDENKPSTNVTRNALYMRQSLMKSRYGVEMAIIIDKEIKNTLNNAYLAGEYICDISMMEATDTFALAVRGIYENVLDLKDSLNLEASYWDQRIQKEYRINDMLFTLEGDYTYFDELKTLVVLYNESIYDNYGFRKEYGSPYSLVEKNDWTYETMMNMIKDLAIDKNDDGKMDENDNWGMVSELTAPYYFFLGSGLKIMDNDNGELKLNLKETSSYERIYNVIEEMMTMVTNKDIVMANAKNVFTPGGSMWTKASNIFENDQALFRTTTLSAVTRLKNMKSNYGILPVPQIFDDQEGYYCWVSGNSSAPLAIYGACEDVTRTAEITERMCYHSRYGVDNLYSAFFDEMAYSRICRTQEDIDMLSLVVDSKTFDVDQVTKITGIESKMYDLGKLNQTDKLSSTLSGLVEMSESKLNKYLMDMIEGNS